MPSGLIFITGGTGFVGAHVVKQALEAGYRARLSVRRESSIDEFKKLFPERFAQLEFVVIRDFTTEGAFKDALDGVDYLIHLASPIPGKGTDVRDYVDPAVKGTVSILEAAQTAPSIRRVIIDSSGMAFMPIDWMLQEDLELKEGTSGSIAVDLDSPALHSNPHGDSLKYHVSKILAHRACLNWADEHGPLRFEIVTLHPSTAIGRHLLQAPATPGSSNSLVWDSLFLEQPLIPMFVVDVRDIALAHLRALDAELAPGVTEFLLSKPDGTWEQVVEFVGKKYPGLEMKLKGPFPPPLRVRVEKAEKVLGLRWRDLEDSMSYLVDQQIELGLANA